MNRYRFTYLMITFLCVLVASPTVEHFRLSGIDFRLNFFITLLLLSCIHALSDNHPRPSWRRW